jgi:uroporphyrinogen decarboxylase
MLHSCGASSWAFEDFLEMGVTVMDTLQPEAKGMDAATLKARFGGRMAFHGCISTSGAVAGGNAQDAADHARQVLEIMMPGGGYAFSPSHQLQDNSPTENVLALYETAREYGRYAAR